MGDRSERAGLLSLVAESCTWLGDADCSSAINRRFDALTDSWFRRVCALDLRDRLPDRIASFLSLVLRTISQADHAELLRVPRFRQLAWHAPEALSSYQLCLLLKVAYSFAASAGLMPLIGDGLWEPFGQHLLGRNRTAAAGPVRIDSCSDHPVQPTPGYEAGYQFDEARTRLATENLHVALALLSRYASHARRLVDSNVEVYVLRFGDGRSPQGMSSSSCEDWIGAILLVNADRIGISVERLADAVLHEAIHSQVSKVEALTARLENSATLLSPWTGIQLTSSTYAHACFVWYGLVHFWRARLVGEPPDSALQASLTRAESGFRHRFLKKAVASRVELGLDADLLDVLLKMETEICESCST